MRKISIHAPHARSDHSRRSFHWARRISIHAPHARSDLLDFATMYARCKFQSTLLMRGATFSQSVTVVRLTYFNPRSSCEERRFCEPSPTSPSISIHAPHARSDLGRIVLTLEFVISIHAPHARSDGRDIPIARCSDLFQSTLLMRGATTHRSSESRTVSYFNPRSSCEERRRAIRVARRDTSFQSTLLMRGATRPIKRTLGRAKFQSTLLMRGATIG